MDSILTSVKKLLGIAEECEDFDADIVMYLNSVFMVLTQMGVGPKEGFAITGKEELWSQFIADPVKAAAVKAYAAMKVRLLGFDVPQSSSTLDALKNAAAEMEWRQFRDRIIARDMGCDLGCPDHPITDWVLRDGRPVRPRISIHHLNPITKEDVLRHSEKLLDPENAICVSAATHKIIHYGTGQNAKMPDGDRKPGDTCPWRK